jgi:hypothetical protein
MTYKLTTRGNNLEVSLVKSELVTKVEKPEYSVSLSRTGGQGARGTLITNAYVDTDENLILEFTDSNNVSTEVVVGNISANLFVEDLIDVDIDHVELANGDYLSYDAASSTYKNYKLTTARVLDIDNTNKSDGSVLVYNGITSKYVATNQINNPNTLIVGGNF